MILEIVQRSDDPIKHDLGPAQAMIIDLSKWEFYSEVYGQGRQRIIKFLEVCCPKCGKGMSTSKHVHEWHEDGTVTLHPSLVCPYGCGWHVWIRRSDIINC